MTISPVPTQATDPVQSQEQFLQTLLANLPGVAYRCRNNRSWSMQFVSAGAQALCGYDTATLLQGSPCWGDIIDPGDRDRVWSTVQTQLGKDQPFEVEYRIITRAGATVWVWERGRAVSSDQQGILIDGYIADITPFKRQQQVLRRSEAAAKAAESIRRASEQKYRALVQTADSVIIGLSPSGEVNEWNVAAEQLYGYLRNEILGKNYIDLCVEEPMRPMVRRNIQQALTGQSRHGFESLITNAAGETRTLVWNLSCQPDANGQCSGVVAIGHDVTPLTIYKSALARSEANFKAIVSTAVDGIITVDTQGHIWTFNKAAEDLLGYRVSEVIGKDVRLLLHESCGTKDDRQLCAFFNACNVRQEVTVRRKDGTLVPVDLSASKISIDGEVRFASLLHDLSAQKTTEEALRQEHERLTVTIEHAPMGIVTYHFGDVFASVNRAFCEITGYTAEELCSMTVQDLTYPDDRAEAAALAQQARAGEIERFSHRKRYVRKDGSVIDVEVVNSVTHDTYGRPDLIIGHVKDLTPRLRAEAEAREHREKLAHIDRLNTLGQMASGIAHEINQPLTAISLFGQAGKRLLETGKQFRLPDIFDKISQHAQRAGAVIERMQKMVRQHESVQEVTDCNLLVKEVCQLAEAEARIRDMVIELDTGEHLPPVAVDIVQIQQVVLNLLRNGMEAMQDVESADTDTIRLQTRQRDNGDIEVAIIDRGCGVSPEVAKKLFVPFSTTKESGMGMGLSICQRIITAHGGQLGFRNNTGGGATFWFSLPATQPGEHSG